MLRAARRRRRLSMTSLIDVIFLLLLFFMLSSTFSRYAEVELVAAGNGALPRDTPPLFVQLAPDHLTVNGSAQSLEALRIPQGAQQLLVSLKPDVTAQRLTDLLVALRRFDGLSVTVLTSG
ncbi:biopolymer transporter ExbD [uncultured Lentibacter sp.]|uniref:biopolymer transporter ExbD n=1 Tax=uncultured Lentibacter sp. TaxID=1659309 RepID=UPI002609B314|nr:biopolymer transporter ExbD [uncultured Lentibacter sp.]